MGDIAAYLRDFDWEAMARQLRSDAAGFAAGLAGLVASGQETVDSIMDKLSESKDAAITEALDQLEWVLDNLSDQALMRQFGEWFQNKRGTGPYGRDY